MVKAIVSGHLSHGSASLVLLHVYRSYVTYKYSMRWHGVDAHSMHQWPPWGPIPVTGSHSVFTQDPAYPLREHNQRTQISIRYVTAQPHQFSSVCGIDQQRAENDEEYERSTSHAC